MKKTGGSGFLGIASSILGYHTERLMGNRIFDAFSNVRGGGRGSAHSTNPNSNMIPLNLRNPQRDTDITGTNYDQQVDTDKQLQRRKRKRPEDSDSSNSSSSSEDELGNPTTIGSFMCGYTTRVIEIQYPVYLSEYSSSSRWFYNFNNTVTLFDSSIYFLQNIFIPFPKDGTWGSPGISSELQNLRETFRHIRIDNIYTSFYRDAINTDYYELPIISISITADKHPLYSSNNIGYLRDNYNYDNNRFFQVSNTTLQDTVRPLYVLGQTSIQDINNSSIGSWQLLNNFNTVGLSLNIGQSVASLDGPVSEDEATGRVGYVSVWMQVSLGTPQGLVKTFT